MTFSKPNRPVRVFAALVVTALLACSLFIERIAKSTTMLPGQTGVVVLQADGSMPPPPPPPKQTQYSATLA
jgi:hypothetical protein